MRSLLRAGRVVPALVLALVVGLFGAQPAHADDATFVISGVVTTPSGAAAGAVSVRLDSWSGFLRSVTTAADGSYRFEGLKSGSYTISAIAPEGSGFQTAWDGPGPSAGGRAKPTVEVSADLVVNLQFAKGGTLTGIVRLNGQPRAGVKVCPDYPADSTRCVRSGTDGRYTITELPTWTEAGDPSETGSGAMYPPTAFPNPGDPFLATVDWSASYHGRYLQTFGIPDDTRRYEQDIDLAPITTVTGKVVSTSGTAVAGAEVCATAGSTSRCDTTSAAGAFEVRVDFAAYDDSAVLAVSRTGYRPSGDVVVTQSKVTEPVTVALTPVAKVRSQRPVIYGWRYTGSVLRALRGSWTKGATFTYRWYRNGTAIRRATHSCYRLTVADLGKRIKVKVTGRKPGYVTVSRVSASTVRVGARPLLTVPTP